ncbi:MAG: diaminopimelate dehydrogenase [Rickettsiales bacterium]|jgi:diaminopimelate dehydrogenase|nr:diaminopimelate dehydrogenase [Rickettsiales bacterium]
MITKFAIAGLGNIGQAIIDTHAEQKSQDMFLSGVIRRNMPLHTESVPYQIVTDIMDLTQIPRVVLCAAPSGVVKSDVIKYLSQGFCTVDCFDDHSKIYDQKMELDEIAKKHKSVSIIATGWDPGFDSAIRALYAQLSPMGETITTFGPGRSMGHTTTAKAIPGVQDAVSITLPGKKPGTHIRELYIVAPAELHKSISDTVRQDSYFINNAKQETNIHFVDDIAQFDTRDHGGWLVNRGTCVNVETKLHGNNPIMTANMMYAAARAAVRAQDAGKYGCFTVVELPLIDFISGATVRDQLAKIRY